MDILRERMLVGKDHVRIQLRSGLKAHRGMRKCVLAAIKITDGTDSALGT